MSGRRCRRCEWIATAVAASVLALLALLLIATAGPAHAARPAPAPVVPPEVTPLYRLQVERASARWFGLDAQPARMAAQIHQESGWNPRARSPYAMGLTQFTPATAQWLPSVCPEVGKPDLWDPTWSIAAQHCYMAWLHERARPVGRGAMTDCDRWAFALRAYNGGEGWLLRERALAARSGANPNAWREVEGFRLRARWAHTENTGYPRRILLRIEPVYLAAGWPGGPACH